MVVMAYGLSLGAAGCFVLAVAVAANSGAQAQMQTDPAAIIHSQENQSARLAAVWLGSSDVRVRAWGAYLALRDQRRELLPQLIGFAQAYPVQSGPLSHWNLAVWRQLEARQRAGEVIRPGESLRVLSAQHEHLPDTFQFQGTVRAIVLENPHGEPAFPDDLFRRPFDQRWKESPDGELYGLGPVWIGSTLEALYADGVPFHML
jgi:hypothetical protein